MKRIDKRTVELTEPEQAFSNLFSAALDRGDNSVIAVQVAWLDHGDFAWLPDAEFVDWLIGPAPEAMVDEVRYAIHCRMWTCPDHGDVCTVDDDTSPSMAGGTDSWCSYSCGCVVSTTPFGSSRRLQDGTYGPVESEDGL